jgi:hypothetical protein
MKSSTLSHLTNKIALSLGLCLVFAGVASSQDNPAKHPDTTGWKNVFAADFSNAEMKPGSWVMENGLLFAKNGETIWTKESYGNFILDLEFKVSKDANSGVFLRSSDIKNVLAAFEIQVHENTDGSKYGMVGALYDAKPPSKNMSKPVGEWNRFTITCNDSKMSLIFNGEQVLNLDLNDWSTPRKNPDGTPNKFSRALKDYARKGPLGLQGLHGREAATVWYRNIKIKVLD